MIIPPVWMFFDDDDEDKLNDFCLIDAIIDGAIFLWEDSINFLKTKLKKLCGKK